MNFKKLLYSILVILCFQGLSSAADFHWEKVRHGDFYPYHLHFINTLEGWVVGGSNGMAKTTNGGFNWTLVTPEGVSPQSGYASVYFLDSNHGWAGHSAVVGVGYVVYTTDGGVSWSAPVAVLNSADDLFFINNTTGFVAGTTHTNIMRKTSDGGQTWDGINGVTNTLGVSFGSANNGVATTFTSWLYYTNDGGNSWTLLPDVGGDGVTTRKVSMPTANVAYAAGESGKIIKSTDGGASWAKLTSPTTRDLYDVFFVDANTGWIVGDGTPYKTTNEGSSWTAITLPEQGANERINSVYAIDANYVWMASSDNQIYFYTDQTATTTTTTTTTTSTTTTTLGPYSISGTVSWSWQNPESDFGLLLVGAWADANLASDPVANSFDYINTGEVTQAYTVPGLSNGTYYLVGLMYVNRWSIKSGTPETNDLLGEYSDGYLPAILGQTPVGTPDPVTIEGSSVSGKDFELKVIWNVEQTTTTTTTTTATTSSTVPTTTTTTSTSTSTTTTTTTTAPSQEAPQVTVLPPPAPSPGAPQGNPAILSLKREIDLKGAVLSIYTSGGDLVFTEPIELEAGETQNFDLRNKITGRIMEPGPYWYVITQGGNKVAEGTIFIAY